MSKCFYSPYQTEQISNPELLNSSSVYIFSKKKILFLMYFLLLSIFGDTLF